MDLFEEYEAVCLPARPTPSAPPQERSKAEVLLMLLQLEPDTIDHLYRVTGWHRAVTQRILLQLVAEGKIKCTSRNNARWYSVRSVRPSGASHEH